MHACGNPFHDVPLWLIYLAPFYRQIWQVFRFFLPSGHPRGVSPGKRASAAPQRRAVGAGGQPLPPVGGSKVKTLCKTERGKRSDRRISKGEEVTRARERRGL